MLHTNVPQSGNIRRLRDLPVGSLVKDLNTSYYGQTIIWRVADKNHDGYPANSVTLASQKALSVKPLDAREPSNPHSYCSTRGNSRYIYSNIRLWANSAANAGGWYSPQHDYDAPPTREDVQSQRNAYDQEPGFLNGFSQKFRASLMPTTLTSLIPDDYGGGSEACTDRIFLISLAEAGLLNYSKVDEGSILALFSAKENLTALPTEQCVANSEYSSGLNTANAFSWWTRSAYTRDSYSVSYVTSSGTTTSTMSYYTTIGFRPFCNLPGGARVSLATDADGAYIMFA